MAAKHLQAESRLAHVRLLVVLLNSGTFFLLPPEGLVRPLAYGVIVIALSYSLAVTFARRILTLPVIRSGYFTTLTDSVLISAWIFATGGAGSPYFVLWYVSLAAVALRFDLKRTVSASLVYAALHLALATYPAFGAPSLVVIIQTAYIVFVGLVSGYSAQFWMDQSLAREEASTRMADARAAERRFRGLLEYSPDPVIVTDASGKIVVMNARAEAVFGIRRDDALGKEVLTLLAPASHASYAKWYPRVLAREPRPDADTASFLGKRSDGEFPIEAFASPFVSEEGSQVICVMRDITERVAAEEARVQNAERMREIDRLKEIDRFKTQFINNAAHELGTPLTPIKMQLHLLQSGRGSHLDPRQQKAVEVLKRNVDRLSMLVQDVLDVSRAQADRLGLQKKEIDVNRVVVEAVESFEESARHSGITLRSSLTPNLVLPADEKRLMQVLFNLLTNAIKFSPKGSPILVKTAREGDTAVIQVVDAGIGIAPEDHARLFQPFSQLEDPMQRTRSGSGLGLYISKSIVDLHGGKLSLHSEGRNKGTTFTVVLPLSGSPPARTEPAPPAPHAAPRQGSAAASSRESLQKRIDELV